jgi:hypothetical protein
VSRCYLKGSSSSDQFAKFDHPQNQNDGSH